MCQSVDEPALGYVLHPRADQGNDLPADKQPEIPVPQCPKGVRYTPWGVAYRTGRPGRLTGFLQWPGGFLLCVFPRISARRGHSPFQNNARYNGGSI
jgi:hypothetical protein